MISILYYHIQITMDYQQNGKNTTKSYTVLITET